MESNYAHALQDVHGQTYVARVNQEKIHGLGFPEEYSLNSTDKEITISERSHLSNEFLPFCRYFIHQQVRQLKEIDL